MEQKLEEKETMVVTRIKMEMKQVLSGNLVMGTLLGEATLSFVYVVLFHLGEGGSTLKEMDFLPKE